jgi:hypothetical protein
MPIASSCTSRSVARASRSILRASCPRVDPLHGGYRRSRRPQ